MRLPTPLKKTRINTGRVDSGTEYRKGRYAPFLSLLSSKQDTLLMKSLCHASPNFYFLISDEDSTLKAWIFWRTTFWKVLISHWHCPWTLIANFANIRQSADKQQGCNICTGNNKLCYFIPHWTCNCHLFTSPKCTVILVRHHLSKMSLF